MEWDDPCSFGDEYCRKHSENLRTASEKRDRDRAFIAEITDFVRREASDVLPAIEAFLAAGTQQAAADSLGMTQSQFIGIVTRLRQLDRCLLNGEPVRRQRKPYKKRLNRNRTTPLTNRRVAPVINPRFDH
jgi:hypothetical protein